MTVATDTKPMKRRSDGRFAKGNRGGPGNPLAAQVNRLRSALLRAVEPEDIEDVVQALLRKAKEGDVAAARVLFNRLLGKPLEADILDRIENLEEMLGE